VRDITLVIVSYYSAEHARRAVESARATTRSRLFVRVVDNSVDAREARVLESVGADDLIIASENRGYSGGANLGLAGVTTPVVVVSNPDVIFGESCLDRLAAELTGDVAVTGPAFHWDDEGFWLLPAAQLLDAREKLSQVLASRSVHAAGRRDRSRTNRRIDFWRRTEPRQIGCVAGAVMAIDRARLEQVGGFDQRYALYFEEIDLARRLRARGWKVRYVPQARCRHLYNQSAALDGSAREKFLRSERLYLRRWAPLALPLVDMVGKPSAADESGIAPLAPTAAIPLPSPDRVWLIEASPFISFDSAAGRFATGDPVRFPEEILATCGMPNIYLRVVDPDTAGVVARYVIRQG
jgi:N-acetylglucosaminyl-diphospho-decaprenol L-rhamnosyltransferase